MESSDTRVTAEQIDSTQPGSLNRMAASTTSLPEVSVVIPCLNEAEALGTCIAKAQQALRGLNISSEINGARSDRLR